MIRKDTAHYKTKTHKNKKHKNKKRTESLFFVSN